MQLSNKPLSESMIAVIIWLLLILCLWFNCEIKIGIILKTIIMNNIQKFYPKRILIIRLITLLAIFLSVAESYADRHTVCLNKNWSFRFSHQVNKGSERRVDLPHTWNAMDAISGKPDYKRGIGNY